MAEPPSNIYQRSSTSCCWRGSNSAKGEEMEAFENHNSEGKLTCAFKNEMRNLAHFHQSIFESLKTGTLMGSLYPK